MKNNSHNRKETTQKRLISRLEKQSGQDMKNAVRESAPEGRQEHPAASGMTDKDRNWYLVVVFLLSFVSTLVVIRTAPLYRAIFKHIALTVMSVNMKKTIVAVRGNEDYRAIDPVLVKEYIETNNDTYALIDIRSDAEYRSGHIKHAISIPLYTDFRRPYGSAVKLDEWEKRLRKSTGGKREIILYGYRPDADILQIALDAVRKKNMPAKVLSVGYGDWVGGFPQWMPGHEIYGSFNINDYIERVN